MNAIAAETVSTLIVQCVHLLQLISRLAKRAYAPCQCTSSNDIVNIKCVQIFFGGRATEKGDLHCIGELRR